jgi:hypothetical protein
MIDNDCIQMEIALKIRMLIAAMALTVSSGALAAEFAKPGTKMECCCCERDKHGKMASCKDKAKEVEKTGHEGHDMEGMNHK